MEEFRHPDIAKFYVARTKRPGPSLCDEQTLLNDIHQTARSRFLEGLTYVHNELLHYLGDIDDDLLSFSRDR